MNKQSRHATVEERCVRQPVKKDESKGNINKGIIC